MFDQESFLRQSIIKAQEQPKKQKNENRKHEMTHLMFHYLTIGKIFNNPNLIDLNYLSWLIDQNLNEIEKKINRILTQEVTPVIENGGEKAYTNHVPGQGSNMNAMQKHWSMEFIMVVPGMRCYHSEMLMP